jgi:hypothetical protein
LKGPPDSRSDARRRRIRWFQRGTVVLVLAIAAALVFGSGGFTSEASNPQPARHIVVAAPIPHITGPVTLPQAATNATVELVGSGDSSPIEWFSNWGLWGNHNAAPGARVNWGSPYWWQSALDLRALVRYLEKTRDPNPIYQQVIVGT